MARYDVMPGAQSWSSTGSGERGEIGVAVIHGFTGNPMATRPLGEAIAEAGYTVEVPRLPGHGTHWRDLARLRYPNLRRGAERTFDDLADRCGKVVLVGFSLGGTIALDIAARRCRSGRSERLAGVATINAQILDRPDPLAKLGGVLQYVFPVVPAPLVGLTRNDIAKGGDERAYSLVPAKAGYSVQSALRRVRAGLADVTVPVLVAGSLQDHVVDPRNADGVVQRLGAGDVTRIELERSYHVATLDYDAELLADAIVSFVERITAGAKTA
ncbi:MAG: alpha/beta fold hydrolase [Actinobacteria bacterium]|nr:alpha/beta fold hydrolase [Actinomycetota bacterium]